MKKYAIQTALKYHIIMGFVKLITVASDNIQPRALAPPPEQLVPESESVGSKLR
jgi:hypothetical protein